MTSDFGGRTALVTGGASGIGLACCRQLAACGAQVVIADKNVEAEQRVAGEMNALRTSGYCRRNHTLRDLPGLRLGLGDHRHPPSRGCRPFCGRIVSVLRRAEMPKTACTLSSGAFETQKLTPSDARKALPQCRASTRPVAHLLHSLSDLNSK